MSLESRYSWYIIWFNPIVIWLIPCLINWNEIKLNPGRIQLNIVKYNSVITNILQFIHTQNWLNAVESSNYPKLSILIKFKFSSIKLY